MPLHVRRTFLLFSLVLAQGASLHAQPFRMTPEESPPDTTRLLRAGFERILNTYTGLLTADNRWTVGSTDLRMHQLLRSQVVRVPGSPRQEEYLGTVSVVHHIGDGLSAGMRQESSVLGGSRSSDLDAISRHRLLAIPSWAPLPALGLGATAGWEWNRQQDRGGDGPVYGFRAALGPTAMELIELSGTAEWQRSDLGERRPEDGEARLRLTRSFAGGATNALDVRYRRQRRDLYTATAVPAQPAQGPSVLQREEEGLVVENRLAVGSGSALSGELRGSVSDRSIRRTFRSSDVIAGPALPAPAVIDQLSLNVGGEVRWALPRILSASVSGGYSSSEETHDIVDVARLAESTLDGQRSQARRRSNQSERVYMSGVVTGDLDRATSVRLLGSASLLRYDTPDTLNTDDRDERLLSAGVRVTHRLSRVVGVWADLEATEHHLVYLSRFQSANNVTIRTVRFAPSVEWTSPGAFRNLLSAEVSASYTVYDFEDLLSSVQSFSFRQATWSDSLSVTLTTRTTLEFNGSLRLFERGILRWEEFRERPERSFREIFLWPSVSVQVRHGLRVAVGYRSFTQMRYVYRDGTRTADGSVGSAGPTVSLTLTLAPHAIVSVSGWRERQSVSGSTVRSLSNVSITAETHF